MQLIDPEFVEEALSALAYINSQRDQNNGSLKTNFILVKKTQKFCADIGTMKRVFIWLKYITNKRNTMLVNLFKNIVNAKTIRGNKIQEAKRIEKEQRSISKKLFENKMPFNPKKSGRCFY